MNNHINITGVSDDRKNRPYSFLVRFQRPVSNPYYNKPEVNQQKIPGPFIYDWQLVDDKPEKSQKEEEGNLYVAEWQMDSQNGDRVH
jgi:hypothetical protein